MTFRKKLGSAHEGFMIWTFPKIHFYINHEEELSVFFNIVSDSLKEELETLGILQEQKATAEVGTQTRPISSEHDMTKNYNDHGREATVLPYGVLDPVVVAIK